MIDDGEPANLGVAHQFQGVVETVLGGTGLQVGRFDVPDGKFVGLTIPGAERDADVSIGDNTGQPAIVKDREGTTIVAPHQGCRGSEVGVRGAALNGLGHSIFNSHGLLSPKTDASLGPLPAMHELEACAVDGGANGWGILRGGSHFWGRCSSLIGKLMKPLLFTLSLTFGSMTVLAQQPAPPKPAPAPMTFFVTSVGVGDGANLGGLAGADAHCQKLAAAAGSSFTNWKAYLSAAAEGGKPAVNARDRIGNGPWHNAKGAVIARNQEHLHGDTIEAARLGNLVTKNNALNEKGEQINGVGSQPNQHDILTGSQPDGRAYTDGADHTCKNWTSNGAGVAQLGHSDRNGGGISWNSTHPSRGCSQANLVATGGAGLFYCFVPVQ